MLVGDVAIAASVSRMAFATTNCGVMVVMLVKKRLKARPIFMTGLFRPASARDDTALKVSGSLTLYHCFSPFSMTKVLAFLSRLASVVFSAMPSCSALSMAWAAAWFFRLA
ncbi:hypothetical protein D3C75_959990 [compost metagenome]